MTEPVAPTMVVEPFLSDRRRRQDERPERRVESTADFFGSRRRWFVGASVLTLRFALLGTEGNGGMASDAEPTRDELETAGADQLVDSPADLARTIISMVMEFSG